MWSDNRSTPGYFHQCLEFANNQAGWSSRASPNVLFFVVVVVFRYLALCSLLLLFLVGGGDVSAMHVSGCWVVHRLSRAA